MYFFKAKASYNGTTSLCVQCVGRVGDGTRWAAEGRHVCRSGVLALLLLLSCLGRVIGSRDVVGCGSFVKSDVEINLLDQ